MRTARVGRRRAALAVAVLLAVGGAGCSSGDGDDVPEFSGSSSGSSSGDPSPTASGDGEPDGGQAVDPESGVSVESAAEPPADPADAAVVQAYLDLWEADAAALADPTLPLDDLRSRLLEPQLGRTTTFIEGQRAEGLRSAGTIAVSPRVSLLTATQAEVDDCLDDSGLSSVDSSGAVVPGSEGAVQSIRVSLLATPAGWQVSDLAQGPEGAC